MTLLLGDCFQTLRELPENSVDAVVTDPPYGLAFMNKKWDYDVPSRDVWAQVFRVMKPGAHLLSFGGTRTYHRMVVNIEDAGFEIRDQIMWIYGSGFPKSLDVSKAIDKAAGAEREKIQRVEIGGQVRKADCEHGWKNSSDNSLTFDKNGITPDAKRWQGFGTALKPAVEPVVWATKPLTGAALLTNLARECQSKLFAEIVRVSSTLNLDEKTQQSIAQWLVGSSTLTQDVLSVVMGMLQSVSEQNSNLSTALSWLDILDGVWTHANTCTTEMESSLITDLKILSSLLSKSIQENIIGAAINQNGPQLNVLPVASLFSAVNTKLNYIHTSFAQEPAIVGDALSKSLQDAKTANEPIVLARKPLEKGLTVAQNVLKYGTGAINVDAGRIEAADQAVLDAAVKRMTGNAVRGNATDNFVSGSKAIKPNSAQGRWPANVLLDEEAAATLPIIQGESVSRYFYCAKAGKKERNAGLEGMPVTKSQGARPNSADPSGKFPDHDHRERGGNNHPTVKPLKLMEYLCKLITPPGGVILDPFMGSGSTGCAAVKLGHQFIGIERESEYLEIARRRIEHWAKASA